MKKEKKNLKNSKEDKKRKEELLEKLRISFTTWEKVLKEEGGVPVVIMIEFDWINSEIQKNLSAKKKKSKIKTLDQKDINTIGIVVFGEQETRQKMMSTLGVICPLLELLELTGPVNNVRIVSEAWTSKQTKVRPSEDKDKKEVLQISAQDKYGNTCMVSREIRRMLKLPKKGEKKSTEMGIKLELEDLEDLKKAKDATVSSPTLDLFWLFYKETHIKASVERSHKKFEEEAINDPVSTFESAMEQAISFGHQ